MIRSQSLELVLVLGTSSATQHLRVLKLGAGMLGARFLEGKVGITSASYSCWEAA